MTSPTGFERAVRAYIAGRKVTAIAADDGVTSMG